MKEIVNIDNMTSEESTSARRAMHEVPFEGWSCSRAGVFLLWDWACCPTLHPEQLLPSLP